MAIFYFDSAGWWSEYIASDLGSAVDELERNSWILVDRGIATNDNSPPPEYGLRGVVGISILEPLQAYFDDIL